ncbi:MAG: hypothetical protein AB1592_18880 [Pseudomonadota bacterium]
MKPLDDPGLSWAEARAVAARHIPIMRAIVGGESSPWSRVWDGEMSQRDRNALCLMAGEPAGYAKRRWCDLPGRTRAAIPRAFNRWFEWAQRLGDAVH